MPGAGTRRWKKRGLSGQGFLEDSWEGALAVSLCVSTQLGPSGAQSRAWWKEHEASSQTSARFPRRTLSGPLIIQLQYLGGCEGWW